VGESEVKEVKVKEEKEKSERRSGFCRETVSHL